MSCPILGHREHCFRSRGFDFVLREGLTASSGERPWSWALQDRPSPPVVEYKTSYFCISDGPIPPRSLSFGGGGV